MLDPRSALTRLTRATYRGVSGACTATALRGSATELAWIAAHVALYPLGVAAEKATPCTREQVQQFTLDPLPPVQRGLLSRDVVAAGTPIVLVHGIADNRSVFTLLRRALVRRGFARVITLNYSPLTADVQSAAARLEELVERTCAETGYERVHVVGHSLGGLVARWYVQRCGGDARVHTLCTLGSPHRGTAAAHLLPTRLARQLRPGSELLAELAQPAPGCRTRFVAYWSDLDQLIYPKTAAQVQHPDLRAHNVLRRGVGHTSLPIDGKVVHEIAQLLAHLDEDGTPLSGRAAPRSA
ncbi:MAG: alpha/beta fold hydrolase [Actinomycetota bacterium]|nr:alpha/beta fold hydrolase [Actinomycetota bacterium]